jgi:hypothetical protein
MLGRSGGDGVVSVVRRIAPALLLVVGAGLLVGGVVARPHVQGTYVSPHPWADYITGGAIAAAAGLFESARRVLRERDVSTTTIVVVAFGVAVVVALVVGAVAFSAGH